MFETYMNWGRASTIIGGIKGNRRFLADAMVCSGWDMLRRNAGSNTHGSKYFLTVDTRPFLVEGGATLSN